MCRVPFGMRKIHPSCLSKKYFCVLHLHVFTNPQIPWMVSEFEVFRIFQNICSCGSVQGKVCSPVNCNRIFYAVDSKKPYRSHRAGIMSGINSVSLSAIPDKHGGVENLHPCHVIENSMQLKWGFIFFHKKYSERLF